MVSPYLDIHSKTKQNEPDLNACVSQLAYLVLSYEKEREMRFVEQT